MNEPHTIQSTRSAESAPKQSPVDLAELTHADFTACLGESFRLHGPESRSYELELTSAQLLSRDNSLASSLRKRDPFALIFHLSDGSYLPQQIYSLEHARLGELDIFLVPIGPDKKGMRFEAIFT